MKALKKQIAVILVLSVILSTFAAVTPVSAATLSAQQYLEKMDIAVRNLKSYDFTQTTDQKMTMEGQTIQNKTVVKQSVYNNPLKVKSVTDTTTVLAGMSSKNQAVAYLTKDADGLLWEYISSNGSGYQKTGILNYTNQIKGMDISMYSDAKIVKKKIKVNRINTVQISAQVKGSDVVKLLDQMGMSKEINEIWGDSVNAFQNVIEIDIAPKGCSKGKGVEFLREYMRETYGDIKLYGIGDSINDLPLLEASDVSYTFPYAPKIVQEKATKVVETIVDALEDSMND